MKITLFKKNSNKETIVREPLEQVAEAIRQGEVIDEVHDFRGFYHLMRVIRKEDGQVETNFNMKLRLPRLCFAAEWQKRGGKPEMLGYNGLVVLEANNLADYDEALNIREAAKRLPQTLMAFLGASGRSVKIVCRGELLPDNLTKKDDLARKLPETPEDIERFHLILYNTARKAYNAQLDITVEALKPRLDRTVYMSVDPELLYRPKALPFYIDMKEEPEKSYIEPGSNLDHLLMPGRTVQRSYHLNYQFVLDTVLGRYFDLPDENRVAELLMQVAARCLEEGIPQAIAQNLTMLHPIFNSDKLLVEKTFESVYAIQNQEDYYKRRKLRPLHSVPEDTLLMMKTDIFLHTNYEMRKNLMTGVAQYRDRNGFSEEFHDLDDEARNEMTLRAKEHGLKSWDRDIARFIESPRIEKYDPVNTWLDSLGPWDRKDRIEELARRVPNNQPHWEQYLHTWLLGMVAHWMGRSKLTGNALVPLLIGRQGCGKSSFCRILLPPELREYYNDRINFKNETDLNLGLTSFALINIDEFDKTTARQQVLLKYLLSTADVKFRPPYGKAYKQYRRYASFIGTTNQPKPLTDPTGSRRFVCVEVTDLIDFSDTIDHKQLFAQLIEEVKEGARYWLTDEETQTLIEENERFQRIDSVAEMINELYRVPQPGEKATYFSSLEILERMQKRFGKTMLKSVTPKKVGDTLSSLQFGLTSEHKRKGNCYLLIER